MTQLFGGTWSSMPAFVLSGLRITSYCQSLGCLAISCLAMILLSGEELPIYPGKFTWEEQSSGIVLITWKKWFWVVQEFTAVDAVLQQYPKWGTHFSSCWRVGSWWFLVEPVTGNHPQRVALHKVTFLPLADTLPEGRTIVKDHPRFWAPDKISWSLSGNCITVQLLYLVLFPKSLSVILEDRSQ